MKVPCMLSEFDRPSLRWILKAPGPVVWAPILSLAWGLLNCVFGDLAGTNAMAIKFVLATKPDAQQVASFSHIFGYMGEVNHGWFYIVGLPLFLFLWFLCLTSLSNALQSLSTRKRLLTKAGRILDPIRVIADKNRRWINPIFVFAIPFFIILDLIGEARSIFAAKDGYERSTAWDIGHIQSDQMPLWIKFFNDQSEFRNPDLARWHLLEGKTVVAEFQKEILHRVASKTLSSNLPKLNTELEKLPRFATLD
jgi:hypothetical protein